MKELAPRAATVAVCVKTSRKTSTIAMIKVESQHFKPILMSLLTYLLHCCGIIVVVQFLFFESGAAGPMPHTGKRESGHRPPYAPRPAAQAVQSLALTMLAIGDKP
jgi:hypothetical protein